MIHAGFGAAGAHPAAVRVPGPGCGSCAWTRLRFVCLDPAAVRVPVPWRPRCPGTGGRPRKHRCRRPLPARGLAGWGGGDPIHGHRGIRRPAPTSRGRGPATDWCLRRRPLADAGHDVHCLLNRPAARSPGGGDSGNGPPGGTVSGGRRLVPLNSARAGMAGTARLARSAFATPWCRSAFERGGDGRRLPVPQLGRLHPQRPRQVQAHGPACGWPSL